MDDQRQKINGFEDLNRMLNRSQQGLTLLEVVIGIALVVTLATLFSPDFLFVGRARREREQFIAAINALMQVAWQETIKTNSISKVVWDIKNHHVSAYNAPLWRGVGEPKFQLIPNELASYSWPNHIEIKQFFIEEFDEMNKNGRKTTELWFYIAASGLAQRVVINCIDTSSIADGGKPYRIGLVLNPFNAQFEVYDTFQQ